MDSTNISETVNVANGVDWRTIILFIAAIAGWSAFFIQRLALKRSRDQDWVSWEEVFVKYKREHLKPFADIIEKAYNEFIKNHRHPSFLEKWEDAVHSAKWPRNLPMPENLPLQLWRVRYGVGLDAEDEFLFKFAEAIYPQFNPSDKRPLHERSIIVSPDEFSIFHDARGGMADYFELCGNMMERSRYFAEFLERKVRKNHYYKVKIIAYLELACVRALGETSETGPGKIGGSIWIPDR